MPTKPAKKKNTKSKKSETVEETPVAGETVETVEETPEVEEPASDLPKFAVAKKKSDPSVTISSAPVEETPPAPPMPSEPPVSVEDMDEEDEDIPADELEKLEAQYDMSQSNIIPIEVSNKIDIVANSGAKSRVRAVKTHIMDFNQDTHDLWGAIAPKGEFIFKKYKKDAKPPTHVVCGYFKEQIQVFTWRARPVGSVNRWVASLLVKAERRKLAITVKDIFVLKPVKIGKFVQGVENDLPNPSVEEKIEWLEKKLSSDRISPEYREVWEEELNALLELQKQANSQAV